MFSGGGAKIGSDLIGTADNCTFVLRSAIPQEPSARFLLTTEKPFIFLKSAKEEHIFTDQAYICLLGKAAAGTKRLVTRFDYFSNPLRDVRFETGGVGITDQDHELKFVIGRNEISIDIKKPELEAGVQAYRALVAVANYQARNLSMIGAITSSLHNKNIHLNITKDDKELATTLAAVNSGSIADVVNVFNQFNPISYEHVLNQYLG